MAWSLLPQSPNSFNWTWVLELIVVVLLVTWFLFYSNRLFAAAVSYGLRAYTWHKFRIWIDVQAIQISLLGGRLFFKGLQYHGENEIVLIQLGYVTWRYWLQSTRQVSLADETVQKDAKSEGDQDSDSASSPSSPTNRASKPAKKEKRYDARIAVTVTGLEWYVYNRTPAYDAILEASTRAQKQNDLAQHDDGSSQSGSLSFKNVPVARNAEKRELASSSSGHSSVNQEKSPGKPVSLEQNSTQGPRSPTTDDESFDFARKEASVSPFHTLVLKLLPLGIECTKGAISLGNESTRALVVTTFTKAKGHIDAGRSEARDIYRQVFDFDIEHPVVQMKPNPEFRQSQHATAERVLQGLGSPFKERRWWQFSARWPHRKFKAGNQLRKLIPGFTRSVESFRPNHRARMPKPSYTLYDREAEQANAWHGLDRYLDENEHEGHEAWAQVDYARFSTILDSPAVHLNFYWDTPGPSVAEGPAELLEPLDSEEKATPPPAYGMDLIVKGGDVNYGPWADRLRLEVQSAFFPNPYHNAIPAEPLGVGSERQYTVMTIRVYIEQDVTLRVPTREQSKDWQWRGRAHAVREAAIQRKKRERRHFRFGRAHKTTHAPEIRPFGWMSFTVGPDSTVCYNMGMLAGSDGYRNTLSLLLKDTRAMSSVNHALLWRCPSHTIDCDLSYPLGWNDLHHWTFNVQSDDLEMFILRDHMFLLIDLINDFTAGQKSEFMTFVPYRYKIGLLFNHLKLYLNANDFNIIDSPCDLEENAYLILGFGMLNGLVEIPLEHFAPRQSKVVFHADGENGTLDVSAPTWNTLHTFLKDPEVPDLQTLATLKGLKLDGSYNYFTKIAPNLSDSLLMTITGYSPKFYLHGFLIRYFNNVKENYFGEHLHFRTLEEYQDIINDLDNIPLRAQRPLKKENDLDVILTVRAENCSIVLPTNIYTRRKGVRADVPLVEADMRFTNYYMDLQVNSSPVEASIETAVGPGNPPDVTNCQLYIESAVVVGQRFFGAPPSEPTYSCHWDVDVGLIYGECSAEFLSALIQSVQSLIFTIDDFENALPDVLSVPVHDVNFFRVRTASTKLWIVLDSAAFLAELAPAAIDVNDWVGKNFSKRINVDVPHVSLGAVNLTSALRRQKAPDNTVQTLALFETSCRLGVLDKAAELSHMRFLQQQHIRYHDQRTHRAEWLLHDSQHRNGLPQSQVPEWSQDPPAIPTPGMPEPLTSIRLEDDRVAPLRSTRVRRQQSFLSTTSSLRSTESLLKRRHNTTSSGVSPGSSRKLYRRLNDLDKTRAQQQATDAATLQQRLLGSKSGPSSGSLPFSSSWSMPRFALLDVHLNDSDLPDTPSTTQAEDRGGPGKEAEPEDSRDFAHIGILCLLQNGLRGFFTPALLGPISDLVRALQPTSPLDRLDRVQQGVMELVMRRLKPQKASKDVDLAIRLPSAQIRVINAAASTDIGTAGVKDQYDIRVLDGHADCRFMTRPLNHHESPLSSQGFLVHTSMRNLSISVSDNAPEPRRPASASIDLSAIGMWLSVTERIRGTVQVNNIISKLGASQVHQTAELLHRSATMIEHAVTTFSSLDDSSKTQHLVFHLTQSSTSISDPVFLSRPSYVLRSVGAHARSTESWKILARLRSTFAAEEGRDPSSNTCHCEDLPLEDSAREEMISMFERWRTWDAVPDRKIPVMVAIFGHDVALDGSSAGPQPLQLEIVLGEVSLTLNPGTRSSNIVLNGIETAIAFDPGTGGLKSPPGTQKLAVQAFMGALAMNLDWDLVELTADIMRLASARTQGRQQGQDQSEQLPSRESAKSKLALEVVVGADLASIALRSPNMLVKLGAEVLRCSSAIQPQPEMEPLAVFTVASDTALARLDGLQRTLISWKLTGPKVYGSFRPTSKATDEAGSLRVGADCDRLRFNLREDIPTVLRLAQVVIDTEVSEILQHISDLPPALNTHSASIETGTVPMVDLRIAMFLHDYKLDFTLLPSLRYAIAGKVARTSILPRGHGQFVIDFDLKKHQHYFRGIWTDSFEEPAVLHMPAINGQTSFVTAESITTLRAHVTVEQIEFEAAAVRACFDVMNQPGFISAVRDAQADVSGLQSAIERIAGQQTGSVPIKPDAASQSLRFAVNATLEGLRVHCVAPALQSKDAYADLSVGFGATALRVHNEVPDSQSVHELPQFHVYLRDLGVNLYRHTREGKFNYGKIGLGFSISGVTESDDPGNQLRVYNAASEGINVEMFEETASLVVDVVAYLQDRIKSITISDEAKNLKPIRRLTMAALAERPTDLNAESDRASDNGTESTLFTSVFALDVDHIQVRWGLHDEALVSPGRTLEDLIFSIRKINLRTRQEGSARLSIFDTQLQLVPHSQDAIARTANSALLPEMIFSAAYLSTKKDRRLAFQAKGKALDLRLAADFIVPASAIQKSLAAASTELRSAKARFGTSAATPELKQTRGALLGRKRLGSLLMDINFAGAIVHVTPRQETQQHSSAFGFFKGPKRSRAGRYSQAVHGEDASQAVLQAPCVAIKVQYHDNGSEDPVLSTEIKVAASSNTLYPSVVPLILDISASIKEIMGNNHAVEKNDNETVQTTTKYLSDATLASGDPTAILGRVKLNGGLLIQRQEFSLSCQPIARVSATAKFEEIFLTINTVQAPDHSRFFSVLTTFNHLQASVQHVYSRESTANFDLDSIMVSLMNSKHVSGTTGISAILKISPLKADINARQVQDFMLFREIWYPAELRSSRKATTPVSAAADTQAFAIQRYQQMTASGTLPWNAILAIEEVKLNVDFGSSLGKSTFVVSNLWASSKKNSDAEQNLCIGFDRVAIDSTGRMSGFVELQGFRVRSSIRWPADAATSTRAPLVQASIGFDHLRVKAAFDYQPFAVADISTFETMMYNVRQDHGRENDRLVAILNGGKVQAFCTALAGAQGLALVQAFERLIQEKQEAYVSSLHELDRYLRRRSVFPTSTWASAAAENAESKKLAPIREGFSLHTDVVVTLNGVDIGIFPGSFFDNQILKVEASDVQARFAVTTTEGRIHSGLGMQLGQVRVALSTSSKPTTQALGEVSVPNVIERATTSRGGTILRIPRLVASMQTWQAANSNVIEYIFRSTFEGKVDVGWNYSRISFIRGMWSTHSRAFAQRLGKPLPESAVKITAEPAPETSEGGPKGQEKITAVVNMPTNSKFVYVPLEPPVIDTPQLRDMGEATPPLEWIGLHRDRLPEATHGVAIVTLMEVAKEVEDAYIRILGST